MSLTYVNDYHSLRGYAAWTGLDADKVAAIIRATSRLATAYKWQGSRTYKRVQGTFMPRTGLVDCEGNTIGSSEIFSEAEQACAELALLELVKPSSTTAATSTSSSAQVKKDKVGALE